jgi:hypothetical protein
VAQGKGMRAALGRERHRDRGEIGKAKAIYLLD